MRKYKNDDAQMIAETIGHEATIKLILGLGGLYFYVPKVSGIILKELHEAGQTISQLATQTGMKENSVLRRIQKAKAANVEGGGFGEVMEIVAGIVGREAVVKLCLAWGGSFLYVPKAHKELVKEIYLNSDLHAVQIAALCSCSLRTVYRAIEGLPPRDTQTGKNNTPANGYFKKQTIDFQTNDNQ